MKPKSLIKFCEDNAKEILKHNPVEQNSLMKFRMCCVLRPYLLPKKIEDKMTPIELNEYTMQSDQFNTRDHIPVALKWVKKWVNQK